MRLYNLKDHSETVSFTEAVLRGIGSGQGLFFPAEIAALPDVDGLLKKSLPERSALILRHLVGDEAVPLEEIVTRAFTFPAPLVPLSDGTYALELFHGPTLAFKDFGARFMAGVLGALAAGRRLTILTATSGDTGAAVAGAFYGVPGIDVVVLYPEGKISDLQEKLIATLGGNVRAVRVRGTFDACQDLVKQAFDDPDLRQGLGLNSANSINISRLVAQICYYFEAVAQLPEAQRSRVVFSVPCGNFGNLTAGLLARRLGLDCRFVVACNANDTVPRYLKSGRWEPRPTIATLSNAMDISRPNNWPRVEEICRIAGWGLDSLEYGSLDDTATRQAMRELKAKTGYIAEPHAAIASQVLRDCLKDGETGIFLGTAHPAKFRDSVEEILGCNLEVPETLRQRSAMQNLSVQLPADFAALKAYMLGELKPGSL